MKPIIIETIPHNSQRYETCGDWFPNSDGSTSIKVSDMGNEDYEFLVGIHEAIEWYLASKKGITAADVDAFDMKFEEDREAGLHTKEEEPGDHPDCPVRLEHRFATRIERQIADHLGVDWTAYGDAVMKLSQDA